MSNPHYPLNGSQRTVQVQSEYSNSLPKIQLSIAPGTDLNDLSVEPPSKSEQEKADLLTRLLERQEQLKEAATKNVVFSQPLISRNGIGIIGRNTINVIQGHYGSHKSRLAEMIVSLLLTTNTAKPEYLGFIKQLVETLLVCYIDTERNLKEELPYALQQMKLKAGYPLDETPSNFRFTSIKDVARKERLKAVETFLTHVRSETSAHMFVVLDVVTDCVGSFNDDEQAMRLFDFIGNLCDSQNATFLLVIHQNPGTEKARGHTGTEAANKASTVIQIGYEQTANGQDSDLIRLRFLKLRHGKRPEAIYLQYSEEAKGLRLADADQIAAHVNNRKQKANMEDVSERLVSLLAEGPIPKGEVCKALEIEFDASNALIRERLKVIREQQPELYNEQSQSVFLDEYREGRDQFYRLTPRA